MITVDVKQARAVAAMLAHWGSALVLIKGGDGNRWRVTYRTPSDALEVSECHHDGLAPGCLSVAPGVRVGTIARRAFLEQFVASTPVVAPS